MNTEKEFEAMVAGLRKPGNVILDQMTARDADLLHTVLGMAGEVGELVDAIKKAVIYGKAPDYDNITEELGDLEFYMQGLREITGIKRETTLRANLEKLSKRYPGYQYTDAHAQARADKA